MWGTGFLRAGAVAAGKTELSYEDVIAMLRASIEGIKKRGNSDLGDKTLLDALQPAVDELETALAGDDTDPPSDLNASPDYRRHLARVLVGRALDTVATTAGDAR